MSLHENQPGQKSLPEKGLWIVGWSGFVAAVLGTIHHIAALKFGGAGIAAGAIFLNETVYNRKTA